MNSDPLSESMPLIGNGNAPFKDPGFAPTVSTPISERFLLCRSLPLRHIPLQRNGRNRHPIQLPKTRRSGGFHLRQRIQLRGGFL